MLNIEIGAETNHNQFKQVVESFFRVNPTTSEAELFAYVELESNLNHVAFRKWREK